MAESAHPEFAHFMGQVLAPGPIQYGNKRRIDVRRLVRVQPHLLQAINDAQNDWLSWLEAAPRVVDDSREARAEALARVGQGDEVKRDQRTALEPRPFPHSPEANLDYLACLLQTIGRKLREADDAKNDDAAQQHREIALRLADSGLRYIEKTSE